MSHFGPIYSSVNIVRLSKYHKYSSHDSEIALSSRKSYFFLFSYRFFLWDKFVVLNDKNPLILHFPHHCIHTLYMLKMQSRYINILDFANKASQRTNLILYSPFQCIPSLYRLKGKGAKMRLLSD